ncbi:MAG: hypothetical protein LAT61_11050 [Alcanivorax sp.]|nr:hypothetical protein [Alcanivorax sp.]
MSAPLFLAVFAVIMFLMIFFGSPGKKPAPARRQNSEHIDDAGALLDMIDVLNDIVNETKILYVRTLETLRHLEAKKDRLPSGDAELVTGLIPSIEEAIASTMQEERNISEMRPLPGQTESPLTFRAFEDNRDSFYLLLLQAFDIHHRFQLTAIRHDPELSPEQRLIQAARSDHEAILSLLEYLPLGAYWLPDTFQEDLSGQIEAFVVSVALGARQHLADSTVMLLNGLFEREWNTEQYLVKYGPADNDGALAEQMLESISLIHTQNPFAGIIMASGILQLASGIAESSGHGEPHIFHELLDSLVAQLGYDDLLEHFQQKAPVEPGKAISTRTEAPHEAASASAPALQDTYSFKMSAGFSATFLTICLSIIMTIVSVGAYIAAEQIFHFQNENGWAKVAMVTFVLSFILIERLTRTRESITFLPDGFRSEQFGSILYQEIDGAFFSRFPIKNQITLHIGKRKIKYRESIPRSKEYLSFAARLAQEIENYNQGNQTADRQIQPQERSLAGQRTGSHKIEDANPFVTTWFAILLWGITGMAAITFILIPEASPTLPVVASVIWITYIANIYKGKK